MCEWVYISVMTARPPGHTPSLKQCTRSGIGVHSVPKIVLSMFMGGVVALPPLSFGMFCECYEAMGIDRQYETHSFSYQLVFCKTEVIKPMGIVCDGVFHFWNEDPIAVGVVVILRSLRWHTMMIETRPYSIIKRNGLDWKFAEDMRCNERMIFLDRRSGSAASLLSTVSFLVSMLWYRYLRKCFFNA